ncbi:MAG: hypothetical protein KAS86_03145, partial [Candidatus Omnitrophica bacterium]|nr:hypothetical protein [Candidatus Omnitrophota bacterium]
TPREFNVKGGALFLLGLVNLYVASGDAKYLEDMEYLYSRILQKRIRTGSGSGFGYNFEWKARAFSVPVETPNAVTTVFVAKALLEYHRRSQKDVAAILEEMKNFLLAEMIKFEDDKKLCFNYVPGKDAEIHNANLLVAAFLSEYYGLSGGKDGKLKEKIKKAVDFSVSDINPDFSWPYGTKPFHRWVDNFHTAFNIESLLTISSIFPELALDEIISNVIRYYLKELFRGDGTPKYYNDRLFPINIHVLAGTKILLNKLSGMEAKFGIDPERVRQITNKNNEWIEKFRSPKGYFYCQKNRFFWNRIPYMRWAQAWMFYALSTDLLNAD